MKVVKHCYRCQRPHSRKIGLCLVCQAADNRKAARRRKLARMRTEIKKQIDSGEIGEAHYRPPGIDAPE